MNKPPSYNLTLHHRRSIRLKGFYNQRRVCISSPYAPTTAPFVWSHWKRWNGIEYCRWGYAAMLVANSQTFSQCCITCICYYAQSFTWHHRNRRGKRRGEKFFAPTFAMINPIQKTVIYPMQKTTIHPGIKRSFISTRRNKKKFVPSIMFTVQNGGRL